MNPVVTATLAASACAALAATALLSRCTARRDASGAVAGAAATTRSLPGSAPTPPRRRARRPRSTAPGPGDWARLLDTAAAEVRSGTSLREAWSRSTTLHSLRGAAVAPGLSIEETVVLTTADRDEAVAVHAAAAALALGGPVAATLDAGASLLRERAAARADALAHAAQARLSATVLTAVPIVFAAWSALASEAFRSGISSTAGAASVTAGALLNICGWQWMRALVRRAAP